MAGNPLDDAWERHMPVMGCAEDDIERLGGRQQQLAGELSDVGEQLEAVRGFLVERHNEAVADVHQAAGEGDVDPSDYAFALTMARTRDEERAALIGSGLAGLRRSEIARDRDMLPGLRFALVGPVALAGAWGSTHITPQGRADITSGFLRPGSSVSVEASPPGGRMDAAVALNLGAAASSGLIGARGNRQWGRLVPSDETAGLTMLFPIDVPVFGDPAQLRGYIDDRRQAGSALTVGDREALRRYGIPQVGAWGSATQALLREVQVHIPQMVVKKPISEADLLSVAATLGISPGDIRGGDPAELHRYLKASLFGAVRARVDDAVNTFVDTGDQAGEYTPNQREAAARHHAHVPVLLSREVFWAVDALEPDVRKLGLLKGEILEVAMQQLVLLVPTVREGRKPGFEMSCDGMTIVERIFGELGQKVPRLNKSASYAKLVHLCIDQWSAEAGVSKPEPAQKESLWRDIRDGLRIGRRPNKNS